jgi:hypothetical protein
MSARAVIAPPPGAVSTLARCYQRAVRHEVGAELRDSVLIQRYLFADRRRIASVINGASRERALTGSIVDFAAGRLSYTTLRWRVLRRVPRLAAHLAWGRLKTKLLSRTANVARV